MPAPVAAARPKVRLALLALVVLLGLGFVALAVWQVERRTWKLALIERVETRVHAPPVDAPGRDAWPRITRASDEYRHVRLTGTFVDDRSTLVRAITDYGSGWWLMTPLRRADGDTVLVNRGFVTIDPRPEQRSDAAPVTVTGLLRMSEPRGSFGRRNDVADDRWISRDVAGIAAARGLSDVAPYFVDADAGDRRPDDDAAALAARGIPVGGLTVIAFANNHLLYAITWGALAVLTAVAAWRLIRERTPSIRGNAT